MEKSKRENRSAKNTHPKKKPKEPIKLVILGATGAVGR